MSFMEAGMFRRTWRLVASLCLLTLLLVSSVPVFGHEIGTTRAFVSFSEHSTYRIEIVTDASALLDKLEVTSGQPRSGVVDPAGLQSRITAHLPLLSERMVAAFDGVRVFPTVSVTIAASKDPMGVPSATLVLAGPTPAAATHFTWAFGWTFATYALNVQSPDTEHTATQWLKGEETSAPIVIAAPAPALSRVMLIGRYVLLGFTHILPGGTDHVLFVLGIFLLGRKVRPVLMQVTAFTVAHSITLGLSMYGLVALPSSIVEPLIALSIAYVAIENLVVTDFILWRRVALVFSFGLLHGLGFADALRNIGLPRSEFLTALLGFNVGVECGQLAVLAGAFLAVGYWCSHHEWYRRRVVLPASACIACFGVLWTLQRLHLG
jgi:hypothetical protein